MRTTISQDPFITGDTGRPWYMQGQWPCGWICCPDAGDPPFVTAYRKRFTLDRDATIRVHVSADERYEFFLDGERIGRGSERGDADTWFYESYDLLLRAGPHVLVARVWSLGSFAPYAQMHVFDGFILAPEAPWTELLGSGVVEWETKRLDGYSYVDPTPAWGTGANLVVDGSAFAWGFERGEGEGWQPAKPLAVGIGRFSNYETPVTHRLQPAMLPPMIDREFGGSTIRLVAEVSSAETRPIPVRAADHLAGETGWADLMQGHGAVSVPAHTRRRVLIDLQNYVCAYPELVTSGGAGSTVRVLWTESLCHDPSDWCKNKGNRDEIEGKYFAGVGDTFHPDGGPERRFFTLRETRYPLEIESSFAASDTRLARIIPILVRGMQMCTHETYMDCPYYEQLMYAGDTRLEILTTYVMTHDDRLPRKALRLFDVSRQPHGLTQARYPSRVRQIIAPFALWWIAMVHDYAFWREDRSGVEALMPGVRATIEGFMRSLGTDGLLYAPEGWNFMDWVLAWSPGGIPPDGATGASGVINWQLVLVVGMVADLEARLGEHELAARTERQALALAERASLAFWDETRGLFADDRTRQHFSEHTQCLALLSGRLDPLHRARITEGLLGDPDLERTTIYFTHYLFEAYREIGHIDALLERMGLWFDLEQLGFKTTVEMPEPSRSDCHAWGAHPLYHYFATILGIRPASLGFRTVEIRPQLGPLASASGRLVHPHGEIAVDFLVEDGTLHGSISLPPGVEGTLRHDEQVHTLTGGEHTF